MRFIITCDSDKRPSNTKIKRALQTIGFKNVSVVWVNSEGLDDTKLANKKRTKN
jgi:hypothetical protein